MGGSTMTLLEAMSWLEAKDVPQGLYTLSGPCGYEQDGIRREDGRWVVFFCERNQRRREAWFDDEQSAVSEFLNRVRKSVSEYTGRTLASPV